MKRRKLLFLLVTCALMLAVSATTAWAFTVWFNADEQLTDGGGLVPAAQSMAEISGTTLVYWDDKNKAPAGDDGDQAGDIWARNVETDAAKLLTAEHSAAGGPEISGTKVIWRDSRDWKLHLHDLVTGKQTVLPMKSANYSISGNRVVYTAYPPPPSSGEEWSWQLVYSYDLSTKKTKRLSSTGAKASRIDVSGNRVVWVDIRRGGRDLYAYDFATGVEKRITGTGAQDSPDVSGDYVAFQDNRGGTWDIFLYNLKTGAETRVTDTMGFHEFNPAIHDGRVAYSASSTWDGAEELWLYDRFNGLKKQVTFRAEPQRMPALFDRYLVYEDHTETRASGEDDDETVPHLWLVEINRPKITIMSAPKTVSYGKKAQLVGNLATSGGADMPGATVKLQYSKDKYSWSTGDTTITNGMGDFTLYSPALKSARYLRILYAGDGTFASAVSSNLLVKPKLYFSSAPKFTTYSHRYGSTYRVWGYFKPEHSSGSKQIKVKAYKKKSDGEYHYVKTFYTKVSNSSTSSYSKYKGYVKLTSRGKWRLRAYHAADSKNAKSYSSYRYVRVY